MFGRSNVVRSRHKNWIVINLFAGLLTFSTMFYVSILFYYILLLLFKKSNNLSSSFINTFVFIIILLIIILIHNLNKNSFLDILQYTSYNDRMERMENAINILYTSSYADLIFGNGVSYSGESPKGISLGIFHLLVERGIFGLLLVLSLMRTILSDNRMCYIMALFYLLAFTWYVNPIYWMGLLAISVAYKYDDSYEVMSNN